MTIAKLEIIDNESNWPERRLYVEFEGDATADDLFELLVAMSDVYRLCGGSVFKFHTSNPES